MVKKIALSACALILPLLLGAAADARPHSAYAQPHNAIVCKDGFQSVEGRPVATPFCEDEDLAGIAREHGSNVTASSIRSNPDIKDEVCRFVGSDSNAPEYCGDEGDDN